MHYNNFDKFKIFSEIELRDFLQDRLTKVIKSIEEESDDYLLSVNEFDYVQYKKKFAEVEPLELYIDKIYASSSEKMIPAEYFPNSFYVNRGKTYRKDVIKFHIPYDGDNQILHCVPSTRILWTMEIELKDNEICFEIINFNDDASSIVKEKDSNLKSIMDQYSNVKREIVSYNSNIENQILSALNNRKEKIIKRTGVLASLGVPIRKSSVPATFSVPVIQNKKKIVIDKPIVKDKIYFPEPCLDESIYFDILKLIHDVGKEFERLPSVYNGKEEEHLRDHFLMMLEPNFVGSATGETFNKTGKTDILLRYQNSNVFIGECKFWKGKNSLLNTISQLIGYLTWRDSKAAVIIFVRNLDFSKVIETVSDSISEHPNFIRKINRQEETWFNCEFHLDGDRNRIIKVAVMLYHLPK